LKHYAIADANDIAFVVKVTGANSHDVTQGLPLAELIPPIAGKAGRLGKRPDCAKVIACMTVNPTETRCLS